MYSSSEINDPMKWLSAIWFGTFTVKIGRQGRNCCRHWLPFTVANSAECRLCPLGSTGWLPGLRAPSEHSQTGTKHSLRDQSISTFCYIVRHCRQVLAHGGTVCCIGVKVTHFKINLFFSNQIKKRENDSDDLKKKCRISDPILGQPPVRTCKCMYNFLLLVFLIPKYI